MKAVCQEQTVKHLRDQNGITLLQIAIGLFLFCIISYMGLAAYLRFGSVDVVQLELSIETRVHSEGNQRDVPPAEPTPASKVVKDGSELEI